MRPVFQTRTGADGNCWAACLASLFEVPLAEVDNCAAANPEWHKNTTAFLAARGLYLIEVFWKPGEPLRVTAPADGTLMMVGCVTESRKRPHVVIARIEWMSKTPAGHCEKIEFAVVHDPYPDADPNDYAFDSFFLFGAMDAKATADRMTERARQYDIRGDSADITVSRDWLQVILNRACMHHLRVTPEGREIGEQPPRKGDFDFIVSFGGGVGEDVWDDEMTVNAVDIQDALSQARGRLEESGAWISNIRQADYEDRRDKLEAKVTELQRQLSKCMAELEEPRETFHE